MWILFAILVVLAIGTYAFFRMRTNNIQQYRQDTDGNADKQVRRTRTVGGFIAGFLALLALAALIFAVLPAGASDDGSKNEHPKEDIVIKDGRLVCDKNPVVSEEPDYQSSDPDTQRFAQSSGTLVGNGPPLNTKTPVEAWADAYSRTAWNPMFLAQLAVSFQLRGFESSDALVDMPNGENKVIPAFKLSTPSSHINAMAARLVSDHELWKQTRYNLCLKVGEPMYDGQPYVERDLLQLGVREQETKVNDEVTLPVTNVNLHRSTQNGSVTLLWLVKDPPADGVIQYPVAIDVTYNWVSIVGEIPEDAELLDTSQVESTTTPNGDQQNGANAESSGGQDQKSKSNADNGGGGNATGGGVNSGDQGGKGGGSGSGCGDSGCGNGGGGSSGGGGSDCGSGCSGGGGDSGGGGCGSCGGGSTPTTSKPTTTKPPASTTTVPKTTTTKPPATTTTKPPSTTTTKPPAPPTTKAPDPGCDIPGFCD